MFNRMSKGNIVNHRHNPAKAVQTIGHVVERKTGESIKLDGLEPGNDYLLLNSAEYVFEDVLGAISSLLYEYSFSFKGRLVYWE